MTLMLDQSHCWSNSHWSELSNKANKRVDSSFNSFAYQMWVPPMDFGGRLREHSQISPQQYPKFLKRSLAHLDACQIIKGDGIDMMWIRVWPIIME